MSSPYRFQPKIRAYLYEVIFGTHTKTGRNFDLLLLGMIFVSVSLVMLESVATIGTRFSEGLRAAEWLFSAIFILEYLLRIYCSPTPKRYIFSFYGLIDLIAILPVILIFIFPHGTYFVLIRLTRLLRIFRVLKLFRFMSEANVLARALSQARRKILVFFSTVLIIATVMGAMMFVIEGPEHGFSSIPQGIYWAIVTVTTVGYGDIVPSTPVGKTIASLAMLIGYAIIAIPTGIVGSHISQEMQRERVDIVCKQCQSNDHDSDAKHCKNCGAKLF